jgi:hypothetical protein
MAVRTYLLFSLLWIAADADAQMVQKGRINGIDLAYRWRHPAGKPSELLLRMENVEPTDRRISLHVDVSYQGLTVELFQADTCVKAGAVLNGRVNGLYFRTGQLSREQIESGDVEVDVTSTTVEMTTACP